MVFKLSFSKMTVLFTLDLSDFWAPSKITKECYEAMFLLFANARGAGTLLAAKCSVPGTHRESNSRDLPGEGGGMLAVGIYSHINK